MTGWELFAIVTFPFWMPFALCGVIVIIAIPIHIFAGIYMIIGNYTSLLYNNHVDKVQARHRNEMKYYED